MSPERILWIHVAIVALVTSPVAWLLLPVLGANHAKTTGCTITLLVAAVGAVILAIREG